jgi:hypothetical protein
VAFTSDIGLDVVVDNGLGAGDVFLRVTEDPTGTGVLAVASGHEFFVPQGQRTVRVAMKGNVLEASDSRLQLQLVRTARATGPAVAVSGAGRPRQSQAVQTQESSPEPSPLDSQSVIIKPRMFLFMSGSKARETLAFESDRILEAEVPIDGNTPQQPEVEALERTLYLSRIKLDKSAALDAFDSRAVLEIRDSTDPKNVISLKMSAIQTGDQLVFREDTGKSSSASILRLAPAREGGLTHINGILRFSGNLELRASAYLRGESSNPEDRVFSNELAIHVNRQVRTNHGYAQFRSGPGVVAWYLDSDQRPGRDVVSKFLDPARVPRELIQVVAGEARSKGGGPITIQSKIAVASVVLNRAEVSPRSPSGNSWVKINRQGGDLDHRIPRLITTRDEFDSVGTPNYIAADLPVDGFVAADWLATRRGAPGKFGLTDSLIAATLTRFRVPARMPDDLRCEGVFFFTPPPSKFFRDRVQSGRLEILGVPGTNPDPERPEFRFLKDTFEVFIDPREACIK